MECVFYLEGETNSLHNLFYDSKFVGLTKLAYLEHLKHRLTARLKLRILWITCSWKSPRERWEKSGNGGPHSYLHQTEAHGDQGHAEE